MKLGGISRGSGTDPVAPPVLRGETEVDQVVVGVRELFEALAHQRQRLDLLEARLETLERFVAEGVQHLRESIMRDVLEVVASAMSVPDSRLQASTVDAPTPSTESTESTEVSEPSTEAPSTSVSVDGERRRLKTERQRRWRERRQARMVLGSTIEAANAVAPETAPETETVGNVEVVAETG